MKMFKMFVLYTIAGLSLFLLFIALKSIGIEISNIHILISGIVILCFIGTMRFDVRYKELKSYQIARGAIIMKIGSVPGKVTGDIVVTFLLPSGQKRKLGVGLEIDKFKVGDVVDIKFRFQTVEVIQRSKTNNQKNITKK